MIRSMMVLVAMLTALAPGAARSASTSDREPLADSLAMDWSRVPEYRLVPGDRVVLNFGPQPEITDGTDLTREQQIRPDGRFSVFPIGDVVAAGRTVRELESELIRLLGAEFKRPRVSIEIAEVAGNEVHIMGRVLSPGSYKAEPYMTVSQAVARAGGFSDDAAKNSVLIFHRDGARTARVMRVRLGDALERGRLAHDVRLGRFDIVYVPRNHIGNINVFVKQFFTENLGMLQFMFLGWELFNLDKVFVVAGTN